LGRKNGAQGENPEEELAKSREEIRSITRSILDLANARQKAALKVSSNKELLGTAVAVPEVERRVLADALDHAKSIGLDKDFAREMVQSLFRYSKLIQSEEIHRKQIQKFLEETKIKVVSVIGAGRMGTWFAKYFRDLSVTVLLYDENRAKAKEKSKELKVGLHEKLAEVVESDLVIVSAPISKIPEILKEISELGARRAKPLRVIEISSIKNQMGSSGFFHQESQNPKLLLYSIHPLFGGSAKSFESNCIVQTFPEETSLLRDMFPHFTIVSMDWKEHDQLMGIFLTLPHALAMVFANAIPLDRNLWKDAVGLTSPSYSRILDLSKRVLSEDPEIYFEIQASNPNSKLVLTDAMNSLLKLEKVLKNRAEFVQFFNEAGRTIQQLDELKTTD